MRFNRLVLRRSISKLGGSATAWKMAPHIPQFFMRGQRGISALFLSHMSALGKADVSRLSFRHGIVLGRKRSKGGRIVGEVGSSVTR